MQAELSGHYEVAVIGCGGIGSSALYHAAKRGCRVLGIEQFSLGHERGSSHGQTRIIRQAYFEHPNYVPLLLEAYQHWHDLESVVEDRLLFETGLLQVGPAEGVVVPGVLRSAALHQLEIQHLNAGELRQRFGGFHFTDEVTGVLEARAGYLRVERCVMAHLEAAQRHGATLAADTELLKMESRGSHVQLETTRGTVQAERVVLTVGAWLGRWLKYAQQPLQVLRKHAHWFSTNNRHLSLSEGCPLFLFENAQGCFYGFPELDGRGVKLCEHSGGEPVANPHQVDGQRDPKDTARIEQFIAGHLVGNFQHRHHSVCLYTMTRDQHFLVDRLPGEDRVWLAGGFSGHGFKFASVMGKLIVDWAVASCRDPRIEFLGLDR